LPVASTDAKELFPQDEAEHAPTRMGTQGNERSYGHRFASEMHNPESGKSYKGTQVFQRAVSEIHASSVLTGATKHAITGYLMTQMTAKAGIKKHGEAAVQAMFKEFAQLDDKYVFEAVMANTIMLEQRNAALRAVNVIKEKRNGVLKLEGTHVCRWVKTTESIHRGGDGIPHSVRRRPPHVPDY
jgi:hypothetical protein